MVKLDFIRKSDIGLSSQIPTLRPPRVLGLRQSGLLWDVSTIHGRNRKKRVEDYANSPAKTPTG